jgi:hypothetical protein
LRKRDTPREVTVVTDRCADERCDVAHVLLDGDIEVRDPDDEIVAHRALVHIERMDADAVWVGIDTPDGQHTAVNFYVVKGRLKMSVW